MPKSIGTANNKNKNNNNKNNKKHMNRFKDVWAMIAKVAKGDNREQVKSTLCDAVSNGRTEHLNDLSSEELNALRKRLKMLSKPAPRKSNPTLTRHRSIVLKLLSRYGVNTKDWGEVNRFVSQKRIAGKAFYELDEEDLDELRKKMYAILNKKERIYNEDEYYKMVDEHIAFFRSHPLKKD